MGIREIVEISAIVVVSCLMVLFASLYFMLAKRQKKLTAITGKATHIVSNISDMSKEWAEQLQIMHTQLDLICELSPAFVVCYDYTRKCFSISENGRIQLGLPENAGQKNFEDLIHPDDMFIYEEVTENISDNIRKAEFAESPYVFKIKRTFSQEYGEYLARLKPVYDVNGISAALVIAFINTEYIRESRED